MDADNSEVQIIGAALGQHGPYTFYKAFKYEKTSATRVVKLGDFFFVKLWSDSDLVCIGELLLLWYDKNSEQVLSSLRLYFLPENTPEGRIDHGEDEVLAISEKVVIRLEDLVSWITLEAEWTWGRLAPQYPNPTDSDSVEMEKPITRLTDRVIDFRDVDKEKEAVAEDKTQDCGSGPAVVILSFPAYCRYRAVMKQIEGEENDLVKTLAARMLGGVSATNKTTRVLFCRDTFDYPELEGHELLCNHLAPKLMGRPRGRRKKRSLSPGSESNESECSVSNQYNSAQARLSTEENSNDPGTTTTGVCTRRSSRLVINNTESKDFLRKLTAFMHINDTPIGRIPSLGYKELDLHAFFTRVDKLGGYESVTTNRLWKSIFDDLSGNYISTSAATVIRRHYERFLLPYELYLKGEEFHPSILKSTIKRTKCYSGGEADINDNTSSSTIVSTSSNATVSHVSSLSTSQLTITPLPPSPVDVCSTKDLKDKVKTETKPSALRSIRVKTDRSKDTKQKLQGNIKNEVTVVKSEPLPLETIGGELRIIPPSGLTVELITNSNPIKTEDSKTSIPKSLSPSPPSSISVTIAKREEKENIATCNTTINKGLQTPTKNNDEVPYSSKTPEPETFNNSIIKTNSSNSLLNTVKKRKLDILKEGGLEVTPVKQRATETKQTKDNRPSVIHPNTAPRATIGQLSITLMTDKPHEKLKLAPTSYVYGNDQTPPKVLQSSSIYSHSERTVYGNPKDYFMPPAPLTPRFVKQAGGEILDLTLKSPQKPAYEMMQYPYELPRKIPKPSLDTPKVGSNLEITLVPPDQYNRKYQNHTPSRRLLNNKMMQGRKQYQNGSKPPYSSIPAPPQPAYVPREPRLPSSYNGHAATKPQGASNLKSYASTPPSSIPNLYTQLALANKMVPPYVPAMDSLYFSAMQSLYPHGPSFMPIPTPEQIQFYTELMARNSQMSRFPFPFPQDVKNTMPNTSLNSQTLKK